MFFLFLLSLPLLSYTKFLLHSLQSILSLFRRNSILFIYYEFLLKNTEAFLEKRFFICINLKLNLREKKMKVCYITENIELLEIFQTFLFLIQLNWFAEGEKKEHFHQKIVSFWKIFLSLVYSIHSVGRVVKKMLYRWYKQMIYFDIGSWKVITNTNCLSLIIMHST